MSMICSLCGRAGIRWMGPCSNLTHTECPHCGGINCQRAEVLDEDEDVDVEAADADKADNTDEVTP